MRHAVALRERCPTCATILHPFRAASPRRCFRCGDDLCAGSTVVAAAPGEVEEQRAYEDALVDGWGRIGDEHVHAIAFFTVMRRLATLGEFREALVARYRGDSAGFVRGDPHYPVEYLDGTQRQRMFDLARRLAEDWPGRFVAKRSTTTEMTVMVSRTRPRRSSAASMATGMRRSSSRPFMSPPWPPEIRARISSPIVAAPILHPLVRTFKR